jgi:hypothetical protein
MIIPQVHAALGPLFRDAGLPENVLQILNFPEADVPSRMEQLISDRDVAVRHSLYVMMVLNAPKTDAVEDLL